MIIVNTSPNKLIQIGYEGEDKVTILRFSYSEKWLENGEGIFTVRVLRNGENQAYNAQVIKDDRENYTIDMTVTDIELSKKGYGEMQLVYTGADFVKKSPVYKYYVSRSVDDAVDPPDGDVYTQIIESLADLRVDFNELADMVSEINDDIGDLTELTTANKLNIVESINEVNAKSFVSVDDELSDVSTNPVQNKVIASRIISAESAIQGKADAQIVSDLSDDVSDLQTAVQGKADTQTVSALSDAVNGLDEDVQGLQTAVQSKADTTTVNALSGTVSGLQTAVQGKADTSTVTALSGTVNTLQSDVSELQTDKANQSDFDDLSGNVATLWQTASQYMEHTEAALDNKADISAFYDLYGTVQGLQTSKADKSYVDTQLAGKASTATATTSSDGLMSAQDKSKLDAVGSVVTVSGTAPVITAVSGVT